MKFAKSVLLVLLPICLAKPSNVTFNNVVLYEYQTLYKTIQFSNSLKDFLSGSSHAIIKFSNQNIPVLYAGSLADIEVTDLFLENCSIYEIRPGCLTNSSMTILSLKGNRIETIEKGVFNEVDVTFINLSHNRITTIHSNAFDNLRSAWSINLSYNNIENCNSNWFRNCPQFRDVNLRNNSISQLPSHVFKNLEGIRIDNLEETILLDINLSYNKIKTIEPDAFSGLTRVNELMLNNNQLEAFDENLLQGVYVEELYLNNNNISCLEGDLAKIIKAKKTYFAKNPLDCQCFSRIKDWIKQQNRKVRIDLPYSTKTKCYLHRPL